MADVELPDLPAAVSINTSDLLHLRQGAEDKKATVSLLITTLDSEYLRQDDNLASLTDAVAARTSLDVYSTTDAQGVFLEELNNLSDLTNVPAARNNLDVYSKGEVNGAFLEEANNLSDLNDVPTARTNLDVYSKGESDSTFLDESNNLSDVANAATSFDNIKQLATESVTGVVELGTQTEVNNGTAGKAVMADTLAGRTATTTRAGIVEQATQTEMNNGTADKFPDALTIKAFVDSGLSLAQEGWVASLPISATTGKTLDTILLDADPVSLRFDVDGSQLFVLGRQGDSVYAFNLSTPWDLSTATYSGVDLFIGSQEGSPQGIDFRPDGTQMFLIGSQNDSILLYNLSTPWDLSTAIYTGISKSVAAQDSAPQSVYFKPDGTKLFIAGTTTDAAYGYDLSTPWNITTAVYSGEQLLLVANQTSPNGIVISSDGSKLLIVGSNPDNIITFALPIPWDISSADYTQIDYDLTPWFSQPSDIAFDPLGSRMFVVGEATSDIREFKASYLKISQ